MLDTAFYLVLNMSITGTLIGAFILILRRVKKIPKLCIYILWSFVFIRLVFPFVFSSEVSILNLAGNFIKRVVLIPSPVKQNVKLTMSNMVGTANSYFPVTYKTDFLQTVFRGTALVWFAGASLSILLVGLLYYFTSRELCKTVWLRDNIFTSDLISIPMVYGIFRQRIIIPTSSVENELELKYVLLHEQVHIRRHDNLYKFLSILIACIHFFNPFVWIYLGMFFRDMEMACDIHAVSLLPEIERKKYAETLLNFSVGQKIFLTTAFGSKDIKLRVINVLNYKKMTKLAAILSILLIFVVAMILLTNPMK